MCQLDVPLTHASARRPRPWCSRPRRAGHGEPATVLQGEVELVVAVGAPEETVSCLVRPCFPHLLPPVPTYFVPFLPANRGFL